MLLSLIVTLLIAPVAGCNGGGGSGSGPTKTYKLEGGAVTFTAPSAPWTEKIDKIPLEDAEMGSEDAAVSFHKGESFIAVGTMAQNVDVKVDKKGKEISRKYIELENDQSTLDVIAFWVIKRDGEITTKEYIPLAGTNAFHMVFELGKPENRMKGEQVHFTKDGTHYTLSMLAPVKDYSADVGAFQTMISSFKLAPSATPAKSTKPAAKQAAPK